MCSGGITRLKNHLAGANIGMKRCPKAPKDMQKLCLDALKICKEMKQTQ